MHRLPFSPCNIISVLDLRRRAPCTARECTTWLFSLFLLLYRNIVEIVVSFMIRPSVVVPPLDVHRSAVIDLFDVVLVYVHHVLYILYAESTITNPHPPSRSLKVGSVHSSHQTFSPRHRRQGIWLQHALRFPSPPNLLIAQLSFLCLFFSQLKMSLGFFFFCWLTPALTGLDLYVCVLAGSTNIA